MDYRNYIRSLKEEWVGKRVMYNDHEYTVIDVDYNGALLINKPSKFNDTTAVPTTHVLVKEVVTMRKSFDITVTDKDGNTFTTWGECKNSTAETMKSINDWASEFGHTVHAESYREYSVPDNPGFVEACLSDISGFKR